MSPLTILILILKKYCLEALRKYEGTILFVSHDRAFLNDLATRVIEFTPKGVISFTGTMISFCITKNNSIKKQRFKKREVHLKIIQLWLSKKILLNCKKRCVLFEKKIDYFEEKIRDKELAFANLTYGTDAFKKAESDLKSLKKQRDQACKIGNLYRNS